MNFAGHSLLGLLAGALAALFVASFAPRTLSTLSLPLLVPATVLVLVYLGSVYPDVDLHDSIPRRRVLPSLRAAAVGAVAFAGFYVWDAYVALGTGLLGLVGAASGPVVAGGLGFLVLGAVVVLAVEPVLDVLTGAHRTWTHSVALHAVAAVLVSLAVWLFVPVAATDRLVLAGLPFAFVLGVAVHHLADDIG
jgi:membrane-bound metal-dependent hydrolase YbcI (DUF457 family)